MYPINENNLGNQHGLSTSSPGKGAHRQQSMGQSTDSSTAQAIVLNATFQSFALHSTHDQKKFVQDLQEMGFSIPKFMQTTSALSAELPLNAQQSFSQVAGALAQVFENPSSTAANVALQSHWKEFVAGQALHNSMTDIHDLVQAVLREAYMENTKDLHFYAQKVKFFNNLKKQIRDELTRARQALAKLAGLPDSARVIPPFEPIDIITDYFGTQDVITNSVGSETLYSDEPIAVDFDGDGETDFMMPPEVYHAAGVQAAIEMLQQTGSGNDVYATHQSCRTNRHNPSDMTNAPHIILMIYSLMMSQGQQIGSRPDAFMPPDLRDLLEETFGINVELTNVSSDEGDNLVALQFDSGAIFADGAGDGKLDSKDYNFTDAVAQIQSQYGVSHEQYLAEAPQYIESMKEMMQGDGTGSFPEEQVSEIFALAYILSAQEGYMTKGELEDYIKKLEEMLASVGDDAQLANVDLQNMLQKQQQTLQLLSNISKMLHDNAMSVIRKLSA
tara:strand:+ start:31 stop:1536 length:1506 start_codon:yes stop_codon:yes gene_type:complete